jgi:flagellar biosynthetic protein FliO
MTMPGRPAATNRDMARRVVVRRAGPSRRVVTIACLAGLVGVALLGMLHPLSAAGGQPAATAAVSASTGAASLWGSGDASTDTNWGDLIAKVTIVLALLFIVLRFLGKAGNGAKKKGGRLEVLESRTLAPKASLHLVAIGDRRLVVGLTPSGMVSLAELDAAELAASDAATADAQAAAAESLGTINKVPALPSFGASLNSVLWPLDVVTGRLASFLSGGRVR